MKISEDNLQRVKSTISFGLESFKVLMATLLCVFVPQKCEEGEACTLEENFTDLTDYNTFVLAFNFATLGLFMFEYGLEYYREHWMIEYLDVDPKKNNINLQEEIKNYPQYQNKLISINKKYNKATESLVGFVIANFIFSAVLVLHYYYLDYRTITVLLSNLLLVVDKLYNSRSISRKSHREMLAYSAYMKTPVLFNTIDFDHKKNDLEMPDVKPEVNSEVNSEVKPDVNPTDPQDVKPEVNSEVNPTDPQDIKPEVNSEVNPTDPQDIKPEVNSEVNPTDPQDVKPEVNSDMSPTDPQDVKPEVNP